MNVPTSAPAAEPGAFTTLGATRLLVVALAALALASCCTTYTVTDPDTGEEEEVRDCMGPVDAVLMGLYLLTNPFN